MQRIVPNLWFDHKAAEAAAFYTDVFPDARIRETIHYPTEGLLDFQEEFAPTIDVDSGVRLAVPGDAFAIDERQVLDLNEAIRQYRLAAQPIRSLCRPDCKGLCPDCGADLNQGPCPCPLESADPRWHALTGLWQTARVSDDERGS